MPSHIAPWDYGVRKCSNGGMMRQQNSLCAVTVPPFDIYATYSRRVHASQCCDLMPTAPSQKSEWMEPEDAASRLRGYDDRNDG